jgi:hypothetical protein
MAKTMITKIQEGPHATNIYLTNEAAFHLALRLLLSINVLAGVRIVIRNKHRKPDFQVWPYKVDRIRRP